MRLAALIVTRLIRSWIWFFFPVMALSLWALFHGWGLNPATILVAVFLVLMMLIAAFLAWFWLQFFKAMAAKPAADAAKDIHTTAL